MPGWCELEFWWIFCLYLGPLGHIYLGAWTGKVSGSWCFFGLKYLISLSENWCRFYLLSFLKEFLFGMDGMSRTLTFLWLRLYFWIFFTGRFPGEHHVIFHHNLTMKRLLWFEWPGEVWFEISAYPNLRINFRFWCETFERMSLDSLLSTVFFGESSWKKSWHFFLEGEYLVGNLGMNVILGPSIRWMEVLPQSVDVVIFPAIQLP